MARLDCTVVQSPYSNWRWGCFGCTSQLGLLGQLGHQFLSALVQLGHCSHPVGQLGHCPCALVHLGWLLLVQLGQYSSQLVPDCLSCTVVQL